MFVHCTRAVSFWNIFQEWYSNSTKSKLRLSELEVMYGVLHCCNNSLALNHLIILGKYFLYVNALNATICQFVDFVTLVRDKIKLEKYIAVTSNREKEFLKKWNFFMSV